LPSTKLPISSRAQPRPDAPQEPEIARRLTQHGEQQLSSRYQLLVFVKLRIFALPIDAARRLEQDPKPGGIIADKRLDHLIKK